jgi:hypothetical protein
MKRQDRIWSGASMHWRVDLLGVAARRRGAGRRPTAVLKTSSGKIRRAATRDAYCGDGFGAGGRAPWLQVLRLGTAGLWQTLRGGLRQGR